MFWRRRSADDFADEIRAHIAHETDRLIAEGLSPEEAARAARRAFGNVTRTTERYRESRRVLWVDQLRQDLRSGARCLRRYPVAALVAVLSLAAGIGATTTFLTIRDVMFENPPPLYTDAEGLSKVQVNRQDRLILPIGSYVPGDLYTSWRETTGLTMAATRPPRGVRDVRMSDRVEPVPVRAVTANFFTVLGVNPHVGRGFSPSESGGAGTPPAVLSHRYWEQWFDLRADAVGSTVWIDDVAHTVIGVMPERFWFSEFNPPVWTLLEPNRLTSEDGVQVVVRRDRDMSATALDARLRDGLKDYSSRLPAGQGPLQLRVGPIKGTPLGDQLSPILPFVLGASVTLTLLIACANVAILMIAQWTTREAETAVRAALGASRARLVRALIAESVVLAACAGTLGVCVMLALRGIFIRGSRVFVDVLDLSLDPVVFLQVAAITILTGIIAGLGPALFETRSLQMDPLRGLRTSDRVRQRWSHALVVLEITVTLALLVVTASLIDGVQRSRAADMMFDPTRLLMQNVENRAGIATLQLLETLRQMPGVDAAAAATAVPLSSRGTRQITSASSTGADAVQAEWIATTEGFFSTLGVPLKAGRGFTKEDTTRSRTAIISEGFARQLFGSASPIGHQIWSRGTSYDIIGTVADYPNNPTEYRRIAPKVYLPLSTEPREVTSVKFLVRAQDDPALLVQPIRRALTAASSGAVVGGYTYRDILSVQSQEMVLGTAPLFPLIVIGMLLTSSGIYGVLAFAISRRSRELAIRVAIGAARGNQIRLVMAHSLRLVLIGSTCGIALTFGLSRVVRAAGGAGSLYDPPWPAFVLPVFIVLFVAALATWIPTRRALRINPALLLKAN